MQRHVRAVPDLAHAAGEGGTERRGHLGLGAELYVMLSKDSLAEIRAHVVEVESVLRSILRAGVESGDFRIDDLDATVSLVHACLQPRHLATDAVEAYVLRGVGAAV